MTVTFFGHRDTPSSIAPELKKVLTKLIEKTERPYFMSAMREILIGWYTIH